MREIEKLRLALRFLSQAIRKKEVIPLILGVFNFRACGRISEDVI